MKKVWYHSFILFFLWIGISPLAGAGLIPHDESAVAERPEEKDVLSLAALFMGEIKNAIHAYVLEDYKHARVIIAKVNDIAKRNKLSVPEFLPDMEQKASRGRMAQLEMEITDQYHNLNATVIESLYREVVDIAEGANIPIPYSIHRIVTIMEAGVFDLGYHLKVYDTTEVTLIEI